MVNKTSLTLVVLIGLLAIPDTHAESRRIYTCDNTIAQQPVLRVQDEVSLSGALLEDAQLITLENGFKAVAFALRYAPRAYPGNQPLKIRYTVTWSDDCGRVITAGANTLEGLILNPRQYQTVQSTAFHASASRATLRIYAD